MSATDDAHDITKQFYSEFLERFLSELVELNVDSIAVAVRHEDGTISTGYCNADAFDKAAFAHVMQSNAMWDELEANASLIRRMVEGSDEEDEEDEDFEEDED